MICVRLLKYLILSFRGFSQEWYTSQWGHYLLRRLLALRHYFAQSTEFTQAPNSTPFSSPSNTNSSRPTPLLPQIPASNPSVRTELEGQEDHTNKDRSHKGPSVTDI